MITAPEERVIYPDRRLLRFLFLIGLSFCMFGVVVALAAPAAGLMWLLYSGFMTGGLGLELLCPSSYVRINPDGFSVCFRWFICECGKWSEVEPFVVIDMPLGGPAISFKYRPKSGRHGRLRHWWGYKSFGYDGIISFTVGEDIDDVAALLNDYRARFGAACESPREQG